MSDTPNTTESRKTFLAYCGPLFGKIGRKYVQLTMTAEQVDELERERDELLRVVEELREQCAKPQAT